MKNIILATAVFGMALASGCNKPKERAAVVNTKIASNLVALKDLSEITAENSKNVYVKGGKKEDLTKRDSALVQVLLEGSKAEMILKKVTIEENKKAIDEQLKSGAIAIVVLKDQIKVLKVVPETELNMNYDVLSLKYMSTMKKMNKSSDAQAQSMMARQLEEMKLTAPAAHGEKSGLVEITSIKIKVGNLDNEKNDYQERKSVLNLVEAPLEVATHAIIESEVGAKPSAEEEAK